jgi:phage terminase Nu1 subunit (DNA packaging protein)
MAFATLEQISTILNMTPQMVNRHVKLHGMPRVSRGEYDLVKCVHWYLAYKDQQIQEARKGKESEAQARQRLVIADANLKELQYARLRGGMIEAEVAKQLWIKTVVTFKTKLLLLPTKLPTVLLACEGPNQVKDLLEKEITEALHELSRSEIDTTGLDRLEETYRRGRPIRKPTAKAHRQRVVRPKPDPLGRELRRAGPVADGAGGVSTGDDGRGDRPQGGDSHTDNSGPSGQDRSDQ